MEKLSRYPRKVKVALALMVFSSVYHCPLLNHLLTPSYVTGFQAFLPYFLGKCLFKVRIDVTKDLLCIYVKCQLGVSFKTRRMTRINSENKSAEGRHMSSHIMPHFVSSHVIPFFRDARNRNNARWWQLKDFLSFTLTLGETIQFEDCAYFLNGWLTQPPARIFLVGSPSQERTDPPAISLL